LICIATDILNGLVLLARDVKARGSGSSAKLVMLSSRTKYARCKSVLCPNVSFSLQLQTEMLSNGQYSTDSFFFVKDVKGRGKGLSFPESEPRFANQELISQDFPFLLRLQRLK
jgi:hypothetical protein